MTIFNTLFDGTKPFSDLTIQLNLIANNIQSIIVPGDDSMTFKVDFSWKKGTSVWVGYNVSAVVPPAGTVVTDSRIERNPVTKFVSGGDLLSFISKSNVSDFGLVFYTLYGLSTKFVPAPTSRRRITEDGTVRLTEDGNVRITE